jgi:anti-sigma factor RsiW
LSIRTRVEHYWSRRHIHDYVDGELTVDQRRRLERHAWICPECGPMLRDMLRMLAALRRLRAGSHRPQAPIVIARLRRDDYPLGQR